MSGSINLQNDNHNKDAQNSLSTQNIDLGKPYAQEINAQENSPLQKLQTKYSLAYSFINNHFVKRILLLVVAASYYLASMILHPESHAVRTTLFMFLLMKLSFDFFDIKPRISTILKSLKIPAYLKNSHKVALINGVLVLIILTCFVIFGEGDISLKLQSVFGMIVILGGMILFSKDKSKIRANLVFSAILFQFAIGAFLLKTSLGYRISVFVSQSFNYISGFASKGVAFVTNEPVSKLPYFIITALPAILLLSALVQVMYYLGIMQWFIKNVSSCVAMILRTKYAETAAAFASPFIGQGANALIVKDKIKNMELSELYTIMVSGFSTTSASMIIAISTITLKGSAIQPINSTVLFTSALMSVPCSLAFSKMIYPTLQKENNIDENQTSQYSNEEKEINILHALSNGAAQGITMCGLILGALICIVASLELINSLLTWLGGYVNIYNLTLTSMLKYLFYPVAYLIGIPSKECGVASEMIAKKIIANEYVAFKDLVEYMINPKSGFSAKSSYIMTFVLNSFGNFGSIGIQLGCIGSIAPSRKRDLANMALSAMTTGIACSLFTACIASILA